MGSRLLIVVGSLCVSAAALAQPGNLPSASYAKQGMDFYAAGNYAAAIEPLQKAVELEPNNFQYRFTLAQSLRQTGQCPKALPIYKALVDVAPDVQSKSDVETNMALCPTEAAPMTAPPPAPAPPMPATDPVVIHHGGVTGGNMAMMIGGGVGIGLGAALLFAGHSDASDANQATTVAAYDRISSRSDKEYICGAIALGAGVALTVVSVYRLKVSKEHDTAVSLAPRAGGGSLVLGGSW